MERLEEAARIDTEPFDSDVLDEIYVNPYANEVYMTDTFAALLFRYFVLFDQRYGTNISSYVNMYSIIGYKENDDSDHLIWFHEAADLLAGAMDNSGWYMGALGTGDLKEYLDELSEDEDLFKETYRKYLDGIVKDGFLKDVLSRENKIMMEALEEMEEGYLIIVWNPELNDYMKFRKEHPDMIEAVCKEEDQWIVKLEEDIWEPYIAFYRQEKDMMDGMAYCKVLLGCYMDSCILFEVINPNWICKAVKLYKMLQLANEKLACFQIGRNAKEAA